MSRIRGKNTGPEMLVRKFLFKNGIRYRLHDRKLPGKPDIVIPKYKTIIEVRGCFWHGHTGCIYGEKVNTKSVIVRRKIDLAKSRDKANMVKLKELGWRVFEVWDRCQIEARKKNSDRRVSYFDSLLKEILKDGNPGY